jgi:hypothetical protein
MQALCALRSHCQLLRISRFALQEAEVVPVPARPPDVGPSAGLNRRQRREQRAPFRWIQQPVVLCSFLSVASWCAKKVWWFLVNCNVFTMISGQKSCSQLCGWWEQSCRSKPEAANARAVVFRELVSASLNVIESGEPFRRGEASIDPEALTKRKGWTLRGERRQRAYKEPSGTWETRQSRPAARLGQPWQGSHNLPTGCVVESERPIVAVKFRLEPEWSQGALAKVTLSQKPLELIG